MNIFRNILGWALITAYLLVAILVVLLSLPAIAILVLFVGYVVIAPFLYLNHIFDGWQLFWWTLVVMPTWILVIISSLADDYHYR